LGGKKRDVGAPAHDVRPHRRRCDDRRQHGYANHDDSIDCDDTDDRGDAKRCAISTDGCATSIISVYGSCGYERCVDRLDLRCNEG